MYVYVCVHAYIYMNMSTFYILDMIIYTYSVYILRMSYIRRMKLELRGHVMWTMDHLF